MASVVGGKAKIKPIDQAAVHRICSGQVILDLATAVKELVENALDAGATTIEIKLKEYGSELIEVADNGGGISPDNYQALTLKYHTSKISSFGDLQEVATFGFRGEALSSLCALSGVSVVTRTAEEAVGTRLAFDHAGRLASQAPAARAVGTTVALRDLFQPLPVRFKEFRRNVKREYAKLLSVLQAYAIMSTGVRFLVTNQAGNSARKTAVSTQGAADLRSNIVTVFGAKVAEAMMPLQPEAQEGLVAVSGFVSKPASQCGHSGGDRQLVFINGRPVDLPKVVKLLNETYRSLSSLVYAATKPLAVINLQLPKGSFDVNVTPDKRKVLLHRERDVLAHLQEALQQLWEPSRYTYAVQDKLGSQPGGSGAKPTATPGPVKPFALLGFGAKRASAGSASLSTPQAPAFTPSPLPAAAQTPACPPSSASGIPAAGKALPGKRHILDDDDLEMPATKRRRESDSEELRGDSSPQQMEAELSTEVRGSRAAMAPSPDGVGTPVEGRSPQEAGVGCPRDGEMMLEEAESPGGTGSGNDNRLDDAMDVGGGLESSRRGELSAGPTVLGSGTGSQAGAAGRPGLSPLLALGFNPTPGPPGMSPRKPWLSPHVRERMRRESGADLNVPGSSEDAALPDGASTEDAATAEAASCAADLGEELRAAEQQAPDPALIELVDADDDAGDDADEAPPRPPEPPGCGPAGLTVPCSVEAIRRAWQAPAPGPERWQGTAAASGQRSYAAASLEADSADSELARVFAKADFARMVVLGQFNLGFILARLGRDLFIVDQHASDEKYNFERLGTALKLARQPLVVPRPLARLSAAEAMTVRDHMDVFRRYGFDFQEGGDGQLLLAAAPISRGTTLGEPDIQELAGLLLAAGGGAAAGPGGQPPPLPLLSKVRAALAMRACRSSIMIGKALSVPQMRGVLAHLAQLQSPWNCPHGRPTMRHLALLPR